MTHPPVLPKRPAGPEHRLEMLTDQTYGPNRRAYVRSVAQRHAGAHQDLVMAEVAAAEPNKKKDLGRSVGGTHASVEQCWRAHKLPVPDGTAEHSTASGSTIRRAADCTSWTQPWQRSPWRS